MVCFRSGKGEKGSLKSVLGSGKGEKGSLGASLSLGKGEKDSWGLFYVWEK